MSIAFNEIIGKVKDEQRQRGCRQIMIEYPYLITVGHLNNSYRHMPSVASYLVSAKDDCLTLCCRAAALTKSIFDIYWSKCCKKISEKMFFITDKIDLIRNITVYGGSYAKFNNIDMKWCEDEQVWKLLEYNESNPLFIFHHGSPYVETDGEHFYCHLGIVEPIELRRKCVDIANPDYKYISS